MMHFSPVVENLCLEVFVEDGDGDTDSRAPNWLLTFRPGVVYPTVFAVRVALMMHFSSIVENLCLEVFVEDGAGERLITRNGRVCSSVCVPA